MSDLLRGDVREPYSMCDEGLPISCGSEGWIDSVTFMLEPVVNPTQMYCLVVSSMGRPRTQSCADVMILRLSIMLRSRWPLQSRGSHLRKIPWYR